MTIPEIVDCGYKLTFIAAAFASAGAGAWVVLKGGIKWVVEFKTKLDFIAAELKTNGGKSLRDAVNLLAKEVESLKRDMALLKSETDIQTPILKEVAEAVKPQEPRVRT